MSANRVCKRCGAARPKGRTTYCSDTCSQAATATRTRAKDDARIQACRRCGGPKEPGIRGARLCAECRRMVADSSQQYEYERSRRRQVKQLQTDLAAGKRFKMRTLDCPAGSKWCARCQEFRPLSSFPPRKSNGRQAAYCRPCQRSYNAERRILINFGLTWDEYDLLLVCQDYRCAICGGKPRKHMLAVDHDHNTGEIRGLLCSRCNHKLLGSANDDPARLRRAADYLEEFAPREVFGRRHLAPGFKEQETA